MVKGYKTIIWAQKKKLLDVAYTLECVMKNSKNQINIWTWSWTLALANQQSVLKSTICFLTFQKKTLENDENSF